MREHIKIVELKDLCNDFKKDIVDGPFGSNLKRTDYKTNGFPVLKIQNIKPFKITFKKMDYVSNTKFEELKRHSYEEGDIIMTKLGDPLGASAIVEDSKIGLIVADLVRIRAKKINTKFLCYHLNSPQTQDFINSKRKGTTRPRVRISDVRELPIFTPPLPEQQRIVDILDQSFAAIDQAIENTERNLRNVTNLLESNINQFFNNHSKKWPSMPLNQLSEIKYGYTEKSNFSNVGPKFLRITDIQNNSVDWNQVPYCIISEEDSKKYELKNGDIVFARTGATTGKSYLIENPPNAVFASYLIRLRINLQDKLFPKFLILFFKSKNYWDIIKQGLSGSTQGGFNASKLGNLVVPIPGIEEQLEFIDSIDGFSNAVDLLIHNYEKKMSLLQELKQSILHKAFQGEL